MPPIDDEVLAAATKLAPQIYSDLVSRAMRQVGQIGEDALKTIRLALFPLQFSAALQDRLANYINEAIAKVPVERRVPPTQSLTLEVCQKLAHFAPEEQFRQLYVNLLARLMDRDRVGEAHPAFVTIISQLAPDELALLRQLAQSDPLNKEAQLLPRIIGQHAVSHNDVEQHMSECGPLYEGHKMYLKRCVHPESLSQPELIHVFAEHLGTLGLAREGSQTEQEVVDRFTQLNTLGLTFRLVHLTSFGQLFLKACDLAEPKE